MSEEDVQRGSKKQEEEEEEKRKVFVRKVLELPCLNSAYQYSTSSHF